ncbi:molybdenum cofactor sulfurase [Hyphomicrobium nitrativorans NL23]|uniref:Molybdenum cofactor sulfurase n=1 Tax=Hyphomicrobium nitrativorans NL23 TaxID=1029756 RepID=V5SCA2_9HYPH|nr:MOSC domain-containing protein [Hyphomicrobium nitrativorans]AHB47655.1 molybdenum cofactor sulfurase [Hyphomicrobium nitrativorans NL23]
MTGTLTGIYRYPVKGLSAQRLDRATLTAGETLPLDRAWAIENGPGRFDPENPRHLPKVAFLMLMRDERLASLDARFEEKNSRLVLLRGGRQVASGDLTTRSGRQIVEQFMAAFMGPSLRGPPRIVSAPGHSFTDTAAKWLHVINLASVRELERIVGRPIDPLRFRPNLIVDGFEPWAEFAWLGREIGIGPARLSVTARTERCAATNVDPATGARDMDIPAVLQRKRGHSDFGVYAEVRTGEEIATGDPVVI